MSYAEAYAIWCDLVDLENPIPAQRRWILELEVLMDRMDGREDRT